jgi:hypothetical protein
VALTGALSYIIYQTMAGPIASMVRVTNSTMASAKMASLSKALVADAAAQGDCDSDGSIEPRQWRAGAGPTNGGLLPSGIFPSTLDPWGTEYGYCAWDVGAQHDHVTDNGCGANALRLDGWRGTMTDIPASQTVMALVSAGPDRKFTTTCNAWSDGTTDVITTSGDDVVSRYTYQEAKISAGSLWTLQSGTPTTATLAKDLSLSSNAISALALTTTGTGTGGLISAPYGLQLGDAPAVTSCGASYTGLLRYNSSATNNTGISIIKTAPKVTQSAAAASADIAFPRYIGKGAGQDYRPADHSTIIVIASGYKSGGAFTLPDTSITDNNGGTSGKYHLAAESTDACNQSVKIYYRYINSDLGAAAYPFTVTLTPTGGAQVTATAMEVAGLAAASVVDQAATATAASSATSTAVTTGATAQVYELAVGGVADCSDNSNANFGINSGGSSGWTADLTVNEGRLYVGSSFVHKVLTASPATTTTHTWSHSATSGTTNPSNTAVIATFKGASASIPSDAAVQYCDGAAWNTVGTGGAVTVSHDIDTLYDGVAEYTKKVAGLGQSALDTNRNSGTGTNNTAVGMSSFAGVTTGSNNTGAGYGAGNGVTTGGSNTAIGSAAMSSASAASASNTAVGYGALTTVNAASNTAFGYLALNANGTGAYNTAFGTEALSVVSNQGYNTAFGYQALKSNTVAENTAFGYQALTANTTGLRNTASVLPLLPQTRKATTTRPSATRRSIATAAWRGTTATPTRRWATRRSTAIPRATTIRPSATGRSTATRRLPATRRWVTRHCMPSRPPRATRRRVTKR